MTTDSYAVASTFRKLTRLEQWQIHCFALPCLAVYADSPPLFPHHGDDVNNELSNLTDEGWSKVGHTLMLEPSQRFKALLAKFLQRLPPCGQMKNSVASQTI